MVLRLMCRDGCDWVRVFEALNCKIKMECFGVKIVAGTGLITCWNSDVLRSLIVLYLREPQGQYIYEGTSMAECHQLEPESTVISSHTRCHCLRPHKTSLSPAIRDISISGHTEHLHLWLYKASPPPAVQDISVSGWDLYMQYASLCIIKVSRN